MWKKWIKKKVAILQILQPRQGNLEEGKGKEFPCCTCWRLKHNLETPAGTTQGVPLGSSEVPPVLRYLSTLPYPPVLSRSSLKNLNIHLDPEPQSTAPCLCLPSRRCCSPEALGQPRAATSRAASSRAGAAPGLRQPQLPRRFWRSLPGPSRVGTPAGTPRPPPRRALTFGAITAN